MNMIPIDVEINYMKNDIADVKAKTDRVLEAVNDIKVQMAAIKAVASEREKRRLSEWSRVSALAGVISALVAIAAIVAAHMV